MTFDMTRPDEAQSDACEPSVAGARVIQMHDVQAPGDDVDDVIAYALERLVALDLRPGDAVTNAALCVLLRLHPNAHRHYRDRLAWMALVNGDEGLNRKLAEAGVPTKPHGARWTVLTPGEAIAYYRRRSLSEATRAFDRGKGDLLAVRPEDATQSKALNDTIARVATAAHMTRSAFDRRRKREELYAKLLGKKSDAG